MSKRRITEADRGKSLRRGLAAVLVLSSLVLLGSCGTRHSALRYTELPSGKPLSYHEVAPSKAMSSSIPEVFDTGPEIRRKMLELIRSATDYILIDSFLMSEDRVTAEILEELRRKSRAGVRVHVLADSSSLYSPGGPAGYRFLEEAGIPVAEYNPMRLYKLVVAPLMLKRDHRKFWIVDGRVLFLGGANLFRTSLTAPEEGGNRDFMVSVESAEAIASMIESFVATWNQCSAGKLSNGEFRVRGGHPRETTLWLSDQNKHAGKRDVVAHMFESLFAVAREEIWLVQPYTFVTQDLLEQIADLVSRGVEVNVMLSEEVHGPRFRYASYYGIKSILEAGGKVWIYQAGKGALHAKAIVVDGRWASIGSANLNSRSYHFSKEANLIFGDERSVGKVIDSLEELRRNCRPVALSEARRYRTAEYYLAWLLMQVAG